ncbi:MAG: hypothetical protein FJW90_07635 [Actinobacteria bacterium]|nr:hypothetical protein [Actinomycetota bacterium]
MTAQQRFDLVGVAREMRRLEIRVRAGGGAWSEWVEQVDGTPIWVDGADEVQLRAPFRPDGKLHFVVVSGKGRGAGDPVEDAREKAGSALLSTARSSAASAAAPKPKMIGRGAWGANREQGGCQPRGAPEYGAVRSAVIHHTVSANDYTKAEAAGIVLGICRFHVNGNGWNDIGYQALVDRFGRIYKGRAGGMRSAVVGAQAQGFNEETTAIASIGDNRGLKLRKKARAAVARYVAWKLGVHGIDPATTTELTSGGGSLSLYPAGTVITVSRVLGHRDLGSTECPGDSLYAQIKSIRKAVQKRALVSGPGAGPARPAKG